MRAAFLVVASSVVVSACVNLHTPQGGVTKDRALPGAPAPRPGPTLPPASRPVENERPGDDWRAEEERLARTTGRICSASIPRGFVVIDRQAEDPTRPCADGGARFQKFPVRILVQTDTLAVRTVLVVCSDSPIPDGWYTEALTEPVESTRCPQNEVAGDARDRVKQISRWR
jgi:hypothetical protein